jgi:hypothetical protein
VVFEPDHRCGDQFDIGVRIGDRGETEQDARVGQRRFPYGTQISGW